MVKAISPFRLSVCKSAYCLPNFAIFFEVERADGNNDSSIDFQHHISNRRLLYGCTEKGKSNHNDYHPEDGMNIFHYISPFLVGKSDACSQKFLTEDLLVGKICCIRYGNLAASLWQEVAFNAVVTCPSPVW